MPAAQIVKKAPQLVKPILSLDHGEAKKRVLNLYRAWHRQIPYIVMDCNLPKSGPKLKQKLKEEFMKNAHVKDVRVIDMLVIKGQMELKETVKGWKQPCHLMSYFKDTQEPKPQGFLSKFISGVN